MAKPTVWIITFFLAVSFGNCQANCVQKTTQGDCCVFPFKYKEKEVSKCLPRKVGGSWCATTYDYDKEKKWGNCVKDAQPGCKRKTTEGKCCVFPFKYKGKDATNCLPRKVGGTWCATTSDYDKDKKMGYCLPQVQCARGTTQGECCEFPFKYKGKEIRDCLPMKSGGSWCSTTHNYDKDHIWGECLPKGNCLRKTVDGKCCAFPFKWGGRIVSGTNCIPRKSGPWCSTTHNYDKDKKWGICAEPHGLCNRVTKNGACCVFPFKYQGKEWTSCIPKKGGGSWCSKVYDYDKTQRRDDCLGICEQKTTKGECCIFPFKFKGKLQKYCQYSETGMDTWCATTADYDKDQKWGKCRHWTYCRRKTKEGKCCNFPHKDKKGNTHHDCFKEHVMWWFNCNYCCYADDGKLYECAK